MSKPPDRTHRPTSADREVVRLHAMVGTTQEVIADIIGIAPQTLRKHYREELDQSLAKANAQVGGHLYKKAIGGDTAALIFWMKTQARWSERHDVNVSGKLQTEEVGAGANKLVAFIDTLSERSRKAGEPTEE